MEALRADLVMDGFRLTPEGLFEGRLLEALEGRGVLRVDHGLLADFGAKEMPKSRLSTFRALQDSR